MVFTLIVSACVYVTLYVSVGKLLIEWVSFFSGWVSKLQLREARVEDYEPKMAAT